MGSGFTERCFVFQNTQFHPQTITLCTFTSGGSYKNSLIWWRLKSSLTSQPRFILPVQKSSLRSIALLTWPPKTNHLTPNRKAATLIYHLGCLDEDTAVLWCTKMFSMNLHLLTTCYKHSVMEQRHNSFKHEALISDGSSSVGITAHSWAAHHR